MPYEVEVHDNFHYGDPDERYIWGVFPDASRAIACSRRIVDEFLASHYEPGMRAEDLFSYYVIFGEDPYVYGKDAPPVRFSAWEYARKRCDEMCGAIA